MASEQAVYRYVGKEKYVLGVPRRDLTEDEWEALAPLEKRVAKGLYKKVEVMEAKHGSNKS